MLERQTYSILGLYIVEVYSLRRSLRRGSTTCATNARATQAIIEMNNRWRKLEEARGRRQGMSMISHYTKIRLAIPTLFWRYLRIVQAFQEVPWLFERVSDKE
jgi:hypothetical protein